MIVLWRGAGAGVLLIRIFACLVMNIVTAKLFDETNYFHENLWPKVVALWFSGVASWFLGRYLNSRPEQVRIDEKTGLEVRYRQSHDLMFVKMEYWGLVFFSLGLILIVLRLF